MREGNVFTHVCLFMGVGVHLGNPALAHSAPPGLVQTCSLWSPHFYRQAGGWPSTERPSCYHPPTKLWEGNVFTGVCDSIQRGPLVTITHDAMNLTVQPHWPQTAGHQTCDPQLSTLPLLLTFGGQYLRPVQIVHLRNPLPGNKIWWCPLKHVRFASKWYASYWNAFLLQSIVIEFGWKVWKFPSPLCRLDTFKHLHHLFFLLGAEVAIERAEKLKRQRNHFNPNWYHACI